MEISIPLLSEVLFYSIPQWQNTNNQVVEIWTDELKKLVNTPVRVNTEAIFILTLYKNLESFNSAWMDIIDNENSLYLPAEDFQSVKNYLCKNNMIIDYGTINEKPTLITIHGFGNVLIEALENLSSQIKADSIFQNRKIVNAYFTIYTDKKKFNYCNMNFLCSIAIPNCKNIQLSFINSKFSKSGALIDLSIELEYEVWNKNDLLKN